jgi:hypothetical protein
MLVRLPPVLFSLSSLSVSSVKLRILENFTLYLRNTWSLNLRAIESCVCSIRSIGRKMRSILRTVYIVLSCHMVWPDCCDILTLSILPMHISFLNLGSVMRLCSAILSSPATWSGRLLWRHDPVHVTHVYPYFFLLVSASARVRLPPYCPELPRGLAWLLWRHDPVDSTPSHKGKAWSSHRLDQAVRLVPKYKINCLQI